MGAIRLPEELQRVIERQVADGKAVSATAFLEEAVMRLVDDATEEEEELRQAIEAGSVAIDAGHYTLIATLEDEQRLRDDMVARLRSRLLADG